MRFTIRNFHIELRHLIVLFVILTLFQIILSFLHSNSTTELLNKTLDVYRKDSAERIADLTTSSLELIVEQSQVSPPKTPDDVQKTIERFDLILSQQALQKNIKDIAVIIVSGDKIYDLNTGAQLYRLFFEDAQPDGVIHNPESIKWFLKARDRLQKSEQIYSNLSGENIFNVLVPFAPYGNYMGAIYIQISPDLSNLVQEITKAYDMSGALFSILILLGLVVIFYMTSYAVEERNRVQKELFESREKQLRQEIEHQKEATFTRRIYHAHHKAEKVMGFITEDLRSLKKNNLDNIRTRVIRYTKFVARVIYDMKSSNPPINIVRNPLFNTDVNEVIQFLVANIFQRVFKPGTQVKISTSLDPGFPIVHVNENVVWTILEPLIQNAIDHNQERDIRIDVITRHLDNDWVITIQDDGSGIPAELLERSEAGITRIFLEGESTKADETSAGFGCFIAHENCKRCGWTLTVQNRETGGAQFIIKV